VRSRASLVAENPVPSETVGFLSRAQGEAAATHRFRPASPGNAFPLDRLEECVGRREAGNSDPVASRRVPAFLGLEVTGRQATTAQGAAGTDCGNDS